MARPRTDLPSAADLRALVDPEGRLAVRVTPGARTDDLEIVDGRVFAKVRVKPEDGKANAAVIEHLGQALGIPPLQISLLRGATSREKLLRNVNRRPIGPPYRRAKGPPFALRGTVDAGRVFRAAGGVGRA